MKICFLTGANSVHSYKWIKYFADKGHEIYWLSLVAPDQGNIENVNFYLLKDFRLKPLSILFNVIRVRKLIKKINPDILHAHYAGVNGVLAALSGFHPFVLTAWGSDILIAPRSKIVRPLIKFTLKKSDLITCDAEHMETAMIKLGADSSKINIIYFGIDVEKFKPGEKDEILKEKLNIRNSPVVISLRSLEPIYNIETLIMAMPVVLKEIPDVKFLIAGKGTEEERFKKMAEDLNIFKNIRFIGFIPNDELPRYLRLADVYVSTSLSDAGIASSTAEAMACGLPVVITEGGNNEEWVKNNYGGYLIPVKNSEILAEKIVDLIKNESSRREFGPINIKTIRERDNYFVEMEKMEKIYEKVAGKN